MKKFLILIFGLSSVANAASYSVGAFAGLRDTPFYWGATAAAQIGEGYWLGARFGYAAKSGDSHNMDLHLVGERELGSGFNAGILLGLVSDTANNPTTNMSSFGVKFGWDYRYSSLTVGAEIGAISDGALESGPSGRNRVYVTVPVKFYF